MAYIILIITAVIILAQRYRINSLEKTIYIFARAVAEDRYSIGYDKQGNILFEERKENG